MRIILAPAKKMNFDEDSLPCSGLPVYLEHTQEILDTLKEKSYEELKKLWACNDTIAQQNYQRIQEMELQKHLTPAVLSYEGIAYQYMAPAVFETTHLEYVQTHLRILSGFYGVLKPMDGVRPYRLEMQARLQIGDSPDLYKYWGDKLYKEARDDGIIINLASKEYSKAIEKYITPQDTYITCSFCQLVKERLVQKGTFAKMARGEMVRFMAENAICDPLEIRGFHGLGFQFAEKYSDERNYVFLKTE